MKTQIERKLEKLPAFIYKDCEEYHLKILKDNEVWYLEYCDFLDNTILSIEHHSFQAVIDTALQEIKKMNEPEIMKPFNS